MRLATKIFTKYKIKHLQNSEYFISYKSYDSYIEVSYYFYIYDLLAGLSSKVMNQPIVFLPIVGYYIILWQWLGTRDNQAT